MHATWNFLLKRSGGSQVVVGLSKIAEALVYAPVFLIWFAGSLPAPTVTFMYAGIAATGVLLNYLALARAYRLGDLSFVYPISRGGALAFLPVIGAVTLGERITLPAGLALGGIVAGILVLQLQELSAAALGSLGRSLTTRATGYALLAALTAALYTIWDKLAIREMSPFAYMYLYTALVAVVYGTWVMRRVTPEERREVWRSHGRAIVGIGVLNTASYLLTLLALRQDTSSLVIGLRQLSIVFGVLLGVRLLRERLSTPRLVGVSLIAAGCLGVALS
ncbi:MAG: EamA family transporter [Gemmatimonadaceae bacterium]